ncbi:MAG: ABC transporter ATP-binding protein [Burkholderiales bacterium]|nr:ABC transporter ATP-binding protein [Burkholderiales bacterium]
MSAARPLAAPLDSRPLLRLRGVDKTYANGTHALQGLDLDIRPGEFVSLLGPSGCGKSTALRLMAGLGEPSAGVIDWPGSRYDARGKPERELGFVFQDATVMPWATVADNVYLPLRLQDRPRAEVAERVAEVLALVGLSRFGEAYPRELSGGMRMRVSIARALVTQPKLLLMDEPFAALDEITRHRLSDDLLAIRERVGCTVVFVTHSVYESVYLSSRIIVLAARPGRIVGEIGIDEPYPRRGFRLVQAYAKHCAAVSGLLEEAMRQGGEPDEENEA